MLARLKRLERAIRTSFWFWPGLLIIAGWYLALFTERAVLLTPHALLDSIVTAESNVSSYASAVLIMVATATITIVTFVFSTLMVVLQLASSQLSPRILRKTIRQGRAQFVMAILVGTCAFSVRALLVVFGEKDPFVAAWLAVVSVVLLLICIFAFLDFVGFVAGQIRAPAVIIGVKNETAKWIRRNYSFSESSREVDPRHATQGRECESVTAHRMGALTELDVRSLVRIAQRRDALIVFDIGLGDDVTEGVHVARVCPPGAVPAEEIQAAMVIDDERTVVGDPPWGFRLLVDVANRALSPAVNDPTTAVQVVDALEDLLAMLGQRSESPGSFFDADDNLRVVIPVMSWRAYLVLAVQEIYLYGAGSPQVTQRLVRMLDNLEDVVTTDDRKASLREVREKIVVVGPMIPLERDADSAALSDA